MTSQHQILPEIDRVNAACRRLSMHSVAESLSDLLQQAASCNLSHAAVLAQLLEAEIENRSIAAQR